jgi:hypothetical protein
LHETRFCTSPAVGQGGARRCRRALLARVTNVVFLVVETPR